LSNSDGSCLAPRCCPSPPLLLCALKADPDLERNDTQVGCTTEGTGMKEIWPVRLTGTVTGGNHHPAWEHEGPPAVTSSQEPSCRAGEAQTEQASSTPILSPTHIWSWRPHRSGWSLSNRSVERALTRAAGPI